MAGNHVTWGNLHAIVFWGGWSHLKNLEKTITERKHTRLPPRECTRTLYQAKDQAQELQSYHYLLHHPDTIHRDALGNTN